MKSYSGTATLNLQHLSIQCLRFEIRPSQSYRSLENTKNNEKENYIKEGRKNTGINYTEYKYKQRRNSK